MKTSRPAIWKNNSSHFFAFCAIVLALQGARAQDDSGSENYFKDKLGATGSVRAAAWDRDKSYSDDRGYGVGSVWLTLRPESIYGFKFYADGFVQGQDLGRDEYSHGDLREFYVEKSISNFDFKVGRSITVWGRGDKVNPTDSLTVRDYTLLMTDDEDQRTGVFSTQVAYNWGITRIIGIWAPEWRSPTYPIPPIAGVVLKDIKPENREDQYAFKIDQSGGEWDWSVSYFHGFNKLPDLKALALGPPSIVALTYGKVDVVGADFATNFGEYGMRGEIAATLTEDSSGDDPLVQNSSISSVLGVDRTIVENFNLNFQIMHKHVLDFQNADSVADPTTRLLSQQIALNSNQVVEDQLGFTLRPSYKMYNDTLEMEAAVVLWTYNTNAIIRPKVTYAFNDSLKGIVGGEFYSGPANSLFGRLEKISTGFMELRWNF